MDLLAITLPDFSGTFESAKNMVSGQGMTTWGLVAVAFLAGLAVARGVISQLVRMVSLGAAVMAAMYVFRHRTDLLGTYASTMTTDTLLMISGGTGLLTYFLTRGIINILAGFGLLSFLASMTGWKAGLLSLLPSGVLVWLSTMVLRLVGSVYGLENAAIERGADGTRSDLGAWVEKISQQIDRTSVGKMIEKLDPYDFRAKANLARLLILWPDGRVWQQLYASSKEAADALDHPEIAALGRDEKVQQAIERKDFAGLMQLPQVAKAAENPALEPFLKGLALEEAMDSIVYKTR